MQSPVKKIYITQKFGANPEVYSKFGYKGHNGIDYRAFLPNGERCYEGGKSEVFAPHDGKIVERVLDANGYGNYIKIENDKEGSVLGHFSHPSPKQVGETVKEGQFVGYQGTSGFSTGIHLHWGYYLKPRNRSNGYGGFINQEGLYNPYGEVMADTVQLDKATFEKLVKNSTFWDGVASDLNVTDIEGFRSTVAGYKSRITDLGNQLGSAQAEVKNKTEQVSRLENELLRMGGQVKLLDEQLKTVTEELRLMAVSKGDIEVENGKLRVQVDTLKQQQEQGQITLTIGDLIKLVLQQKVTIKK
jgi:hypothetical protein